MLGIIDYGMCNIGSLRKAMDNIGARSQIITSDADWVDCDRYILPGVGHFSEAVRMLDRSGLRDKILEATSSGSPLLGICLGMQLLADTSEEGQVEKGLGLIPGSVKKLKFNGKERIPHVGWNEVKIKRKSALLSGVNCSNDFYFVHSFYYVPNDNFNQVATTNHSIDFTSIIQKNHIMGTQFHPEKSSSAGYQILQNFTAI